jgi:hypothetical protein
MATQPQYTTQPIVEVFSVASTDTSRSAPSTVTTLCSGPAVAAANGVGKRINRVTVTEVNAIGAGTANVIRFWISTDGGSNDRLLVEKAVPAITSSSTAIGFRIEVPELVGLILPGAASNPPTLYMSSHLTATYHVIIESGLL